MKTENTLSLSWPENGMSTSKSISHLLWTQEILYQNDILNILPLQIMYFIFSHFLKIILIPLNQLPPHNWWVSKYYLVSLQTHSSLIQCA